jgi:DNA-binding HxlR family transcriptional regulator
MLEGMEPQVKKQSCKVRTILESLEAKDKEILIQALSDNQWSAGALSRELTKRGIPISEKPITAHKRKGCSCAR